MAVIFQTVFKRYEWKWKYLIPILSILDCIAGLIYALLTPLIPGVLFSDFYVWLTVALPGVAALFGVALGQLLGYLWRFIS